MEDGFGPQSNDKCVNSTKQVEHRQKGVTRVDWNAKNGVGFDIMSSQELTPQMRLYIHLGCSLLYT